MSLDTMMLSVKISSLKAPGFKVELFEHLGFHYYA